MRRLACALVAAAAAAGGCERPDTPEEAVPVVPIPTLEPPVGDGLLESADLQSIVELGFARDGAALRERLDHPNPRVRARAAFALASVRDIEAADELVGLLSDPDPHVRRNAAFALARTPGSGGDADLLEALRVEDDPDVRARLFEWVGTRGSERAAAELLHTATSGDDALPRVAALAAAGLRGVHPPGLVDTLLVRLNDPDGQVRSRAAYFFGRTDEAALSEASIPAVREALDAYAPEDPAAMHLVAALGRFSTAAEDRDRILRRLTGGGDWRVRANAAYSLAPAPWLGEVEVVETLFEALQDPIEHVGVAASVVLVGALRQHPGAVTRARDWVADGPAERWRTQAPFLSFLVTLGGRDIVLDWTRRMTGVHPTAVVQGLFALGGSRDPEISELLLELAHHPDPVLRGVAIEMLPAHWTGDPDDAEELDRFFDPFRAALVQGPPGPAMRAARTLAATGIEPARSGALLREALEARLEEGDPPLIAGIVEALEAVGGNAESLPVPEDVTDPYPSAEVDWAFLARMGPAPRLHFATERGELVVRLLPEDAPLSVQTLAQEAERGSYDGTRFHRVVPNSVVQGGDFRMGDGTGRPGYRIPTELTRLPFERGVMGLAAPARDAGGSQFFLTHSREPSLDGAYAAVGWVEEGANLLDRIQEGDRIIRVELRPGP